MRLRRYAALALSILCFTAACDETAPRYREAVCCDDNAEPVFLRSKLDDDDGDGNYFDEDFPVIDDEDDDIADHTWIRDAEGTYHLFFNTEDRGVGSYIEHYTSTDLRSLEYVGSVLHPNPDGWDSRGLWAPHVIRHGKFYYMFYTGIDGRGDDPATRQRIGCAVSTDLMTWIRYPVNNCPGTAGDGCIYECDECWTTWGGESGSFNQQCRDPFVIQDPANGRWVMLATAKSVNQFGVVTAAYSTNLIDWTGAGYIDATRRLESGIKGQTTGGQAENPYIMTYGGTHYLIFTDWWDPEDSVTVANPRTIAQYATSSTLDADTSGSGNWIYRGYIPDPGMNAIEVLRLPGDVLIMSQSLANERNGYWELRRQLTLKCVLFGPDFTFDTWNIDFDCGAVGFGRSIERPLKPTAVGAFDSRRGADIVIP